MAEKNSLWKNIRKKAEQNRRTGATPKKPTAEMLRQERKIKSKQYPDGGYFSKKRELPLNEQGIPVVTLPEVEISDTSNESYLEKVIDKLYNYEGKINKSLKYPMGRAGSEAEIVSNEDPVDNIRHSLAGMYSANAIKEKFPYIPVVSEAAGFLGSTALGIGHELGAIFEDDRPWSDRLRESGEDIINNTVGAGLSTIPFMSDAEKKDFIVNASINNRLPDGVVGQNMYFKKATGGRLYAQGGDGEDDKEPVKLSERSWYNTNTGEIKTALTSPDNKTWQEVEFDINGNPTVGMIKHQLPEVEISVDSPDYDSQGFRKKIEGDALESVYPEMALLPGSLPFKGTTTLGKVGKFAAEALGAVGEKATPYVMGALNTSLPWMASIPGATVGNTLGLMGGIHSGNMLLNDINTNYYGSNASTPEKIARGLETGLGLLTTPGALEGISSGVKGVANAYNKVANGGKTWSKQLLNAESELARANADALIFSQSPANRKKLELFRPGEDFDVTNTEALFHNNPQAREKFAKLMQDEPETFADYKNTENWLMDDGISAEGKYGARNLGDTEDLAVVNKFKPIDKIYPAATHEIGHSRSTRIIPTKTERKIIDRAWKGLKLENGAPVPVEEGEAVQYELRMMLNDKLGDRLYTQNDAGEIKKALQTMINENHPYVHDVNDFDINSIITSLNKIGFAGTIGTIIGAGAMQGSQPEQQSQGGQINPYMYYAGGPMEYKVGGKVWKNIAAGAYGVGEGILDTVTMGATDQLTDKGFEALSKAGNKNIDLNNPDDVKFLKTQQKVKGYSNTAGAIGTAVVTGNVQGAISQGTKGLNTAFQATDGLSDDFKQWSQGITGVAGMASGFAGGLNSDSFTAASKAGTGAAGFGKDVSKFAGIGNTAMGFIPGANDAPLWQQGDARQEYLNSPEYLEQMRLQNTAYNNPQINQGARFEDGGNITNNSLNLQNNMFKNKILTRYKEGGILEGHGLSKVSSKVGDHDEHPDGGMPYGKNASLEKNELIEFAQGGMNGLQDAEYIHPADVNNTNSINMPQMTSDYKMVTGKDGLPKFTGKSPAKWLEEKLTQGSTLREHVDMYNGPTGEQLKEVARGGREVAVAVNDMQKQQAMQDAMMIAEADNYAAYGGMINKDLSMPNSYAKGGGIHIKESKKGTFTAAAKRHGKGVQEFARQVLANKGNYSSAMVKKANFARNAAKWKHAEGGELRPDNAGFNALPKYVQDKIMANMAQGGFMYGDPYAAGGNYGGVGEIPGDPNSVFNYSPYGDQYANGGPTYIHPDNVLLSNDLMVTNQNEDKYYYPNGGWLSRLFNRNNQNFSDGTNSLTNDELNSLLENKQSKKQAARQARQDSEFYKEFGTFDGTNYQPPDPGNPVFPNEFYDPSKKAEYLWNRDFNPNYQTKVPEEYKYSNPELMKDVFNSAEGLQKSLDKKPKQDEQGFNWNKARNIGAAALQFLGPIDQFIKSRKYDRVKYPGMAPNLLNSTIAERLAMNEIDRTLNAGIYAQKSAPSAASAKANTGAITERGADIKGITAAGIARDYADKNAQIKTLTDQFNIGNTIRAMEAEAANKGQTATERTNALYNFGATAGNINREYNLGERDKNVIWPNIGTDNYIYRIIDGRRVLVPRNAVV